MEYTELIAAVAPHEAELAASLLHDATGAGAWIEAPFTQASLEDAATIDAAATRYVHVYLRDDGGIASAREALAAGGIAAEMVTRTVAEEDWAEAWKEHFHVTRFGERIVVVPSWRAFDPRPGDVVLHLDPGMAFGTGQHETTRMCLEALESLIRPGARVLDAGCGSGILAIAAAALGAVEVAAIDVDDVCVRVTGENAARNGLADRIDVGAGRLGGTWPLASPPAGFDVVVANIIAPVIIEAAPMLAGVLAMPGGTLVVSGIIAAREAETVLALASAGLRITEVRAMADWRCIIAMPVAAS